MRLQRQVRLVQTYTLIQNNNKVQQTVPSFQWYRMSHLTRQRMNTFIFLKCLLTHHLSALVSHMLLLSSMPAKTPQKYHSITQEHTSNLCLLIDNFDCCLQQKSSAACKCGAFQLLLSRFLSRSRAHQSPTGLSNCFPAPSQWPTDRCIRSLIEWI